MTTSGADLAIATASVIAAIGGVGAGIGTILAFRSQRQANRRMDERLDAEERRSNDREARAQADLVSAYFMSTDRADVSVDEPAPLLPPGIRNSHRAVAAVNLSPLPVYQVSIEVLRKSLEIAQAHEWGVLPPGRDKAVFTLSTLEDDRAMLVRLRFRDAAGRLWSCDEVGRKTVIDEPDVEDAPTPMS